MTLKSFLKTLRRVILDGVKIYDDRIEFDRAKAEAKNHDKYDIHVAELVFSNEGHFTDRFTPEIKLLFSGSKYNREPNFQPIQFYVPILRIIFMINVKEQISTRIFEEDLIRHVAGREAVEQYIGMPEHEFDKERPQIIEFRW